MFCAAVSLPESDDGARFRSRGGRAICLSGNRLYVYDKGVLQIGLLTSYGESLLHARTVKSWHYFEASKAPAVQYPSLTDFDGEGTILLFGGLTGASHVEYSHALWRFEPEAGWTEVCCAEGPRARAAALTTFVTETLFLCGGSVGANELWALDWATRRWQLVCDCVAPGELPMMVAQSKTKDVVTLAIGGPVYRTLVKRATGDWSCRCRSEPPQHPAPNVTLLNLAASRAVDETGNAFLRSRRRPSLSVAPSHMCTPSYLTDQQSALAVWMNGVSDIEAARLGIPVDCDEETALLSVLPHWRTRRLVQWIRDARAKDAACSAPLHGFLMTAPELVLEQLLKFL